MIAEIEIPDPPEGFGKPKYGAIFLPVDPRIYILIGESWEKADSIIKLGGQSFILLCKRKI